MKKETIRLLIESMKHKEVVKLVQQASERIWHSLPDVTSFEHTCYTNIGRELIKGEARSVEALARYYIKRAEARHLKLIKYEKPTYFSEIEDVINSDDNIEEINYEPEDVLADVESEIIAKEMTALLAQDDQRNKLIVRSWLDGNTNTASISRLLAQSLGGNAKSHRVYIHRFKQSCQEELYQLL